MASKIARLRSHGIIFRGF